MSLSAETVEGPALSLERVHHVHGSDGLPLGMLRVGDGIADDILQEDLENAPGLLVDESRNALDSSAAGQTTNGRLGDALNVVAEDLPVPLGAALAEPLSSFAATGHGENRDWELEKMDSARRERPVEKSRMLENFVTR